MMVHRSPNGKAVLQAGDETEYVVLNETEHVINFLAEGAKPTFRTPFCVFEDFLLSTHAIDDSPAKSNFLSHQTLDLARRRQQQKSQNNPSIGIPFRRSTSQSTL